MQGKRHPADAARDEERKQQAVIRSEKDLAAR